MPKLSRVLALWLALVVALSTASLSGAQAATVYAWGYVSDASTGADLDGVTVDVFIADPQQNPGAAPLVSTTTDEGEFELEVSEGVYFFRLTDPSGEHEPYFSGARMVEKDREDELEFAMTPIGGTVTGSIVAADGSPLGEESCGFLAVYRADATDPDESFADVEAENGTFSVVLPAGSYKFAVGDYCSDSPLAWYGGVDLASAEEVTVELDGTSPLGVIGLADPSSISGTVKDTEGKAIADVTVRANTDVGGTPRVAGVAKTDANGRYTVGGLGEGTYTLEFTDAITEYLPEWYDDAADYASADRLVVGEAQDVTARNAVLAEALPAAQARSLTGKVTSAAGQVAPGIEVVAYHSDGVFEARTFTRRDGTFAFPRATVDKGSYKLQFTESFDEDEDVEWEFDEDGNWLGHEPRFVSQWYLDKYSRASATAVTVGASAETKTSAVKLVGYGAIEGEVELPEESEDSDAEYVEDSAWVTAYDADENIVGYAEVEDGEYRIGGVLPGAYRIRFEGERTSYDEDGEEEIEDESFAFIGQYWKNKYTLGSAWIVNVKDSTTTGNGNGTVTTRLLPYVNPKITGTAKKGKTLTLNRGSWNKTAGMKWAYQWYRGNTAISGARGTTYKLTTADVGKVIKARVVIADPHEHYTYGSKYSQNSSKIRK
jgi:hypothetical protein